MQVYYFNTPTCFVDNIFTLFQDIIAVISKGQLVEAGSHDELIAKEGVYANLVRIQLGGIESGEAQQEEEVNYQNTYLLLFIFSH